MEFIDLFKTGLMSYDHLDKPVKFTEDVLKQLASSTGVINLTKEHTKEVIGTLSNFIFDDGVLKVERPDIDIKGLGLSPVFKHDYVDRGDYYESLNLKLEECALTSTPHTGILYNSKGDKMTDNGDNLRELLDKKEERIIEQQEELALLKQQLKETKEIVSKNEEVNKLNVDLNKELDEVKSQLEEFKIDAEKLRTKEAEAKAELIKEIAGETEADYLNKLSYDELKDMRERTIINEPPNGVTVDTSEGLDDNGDQQVVDDKVDPYSFEAFDAWEKENTSW